MIVSFLHKGLKNLFIDKSTKGVKQDHIKRLLVRLNILDKMVDLAQLEALPQLRLHRLKGDFKNHYSIWVSGNWRLVFRWDDIKKNVEVLDYLDYH